MRNVSTVVAALLVLATAGAIFVGVNAFKVSKESGSAIHEIEGLICFVIAAVSLAGVGIIAAVRANEK